MINCEIEVDLLWPKDCIKCEISRTGAVGVNPPTLVELETTTSERFQMNNAKPYVSVINLSVNGNIENMKQGFKRIVYWNKYRSEITTQLRNNNLEYMIDRTSKNINKLFVLSFKNGGIDAARDSFDKYWMPLAEVKDFNVLIDKKTISWYYNWSSFQKMCTCK